jgi:hypothetical protein
MMSLKRVISTDELLLESEEFDSSRADRHSLRSIVLTGLDCLLMEDGEDQGR